MGAESGTRTSLKPCVTSAEFRDLGFAFFL
jgi:hypothetical protein